MAYPTNAQLAERLRTSETDAALAGIALAAQAYIDALPMVALPEPVRNEAYVRFSGYLLDAPESPAGGNWSNAWRNSGAESLTARWRRRSAGVIGEASAAASTSSSAAVDADQVRALVADWAEQGNTDPIPVGKLANAARAAVDQTARDGVATNAAAIEALENASGAEPWTLRYGWRDASDALVGTQETIVVRSAHAHVAWASKPTGGTKLYFTLPSGGDVVRFWSALFGTLDSLVWSRDTSTNTWSADAGFVGDAPTVTVETSGLYVQGSASRDGIDQTARDAAAANAAAIDALPGPYTLPAATASTRGGVRAITNDVIDTGTSTGIFGWAISHIRRLINESITLTKTDILSVNEDPVVTAHKAYDITAAQFNAALDAKRITFAARFGAVAATDQQWSFTEIDMDKFRAVTGLASTSTGTVKIFSDIGAADDANAARRIRFTIVRDANLNTGARIDVFPADSSVQIRSVRVAYWS